MFIINKLDILFRKYNVYLYNVYTNKVYLSEAYILIGFSLVATIINRQAIINLYVRL